MKTIPLMVPAILEEDIQEVIAVLRSGYLVQGPRVLSLENTLSKALGVKHAIATSSGTSTLHLALIALGIGSGDEVIIPALSYVATANVVELVGATPVFVDIKLDTFNIDASKIASKITSRTKAIMPVHEFGLAADMTYIMQLAEKHGLFVIEDAACALGAKENEKPVGSFGDFGSFSFHPRKAITGGEGGILTTNSAQLDEKIKILRNHGISYESGAMDFVEAGFNYRMTDMQAALIESQFHRMSSQIIYKNELAGYYEQYLSDVDLILPKVPENKNHTWQTYHIVVPEEIDRDKLINALKEEGIGSNYGAQCIPSMKFYQDKYQLDSSVAFPNAWKAYKQGLALPIYEKLSRADISYVTTQLKRKLESHSIFV